MSNASVDGMETTRAFTPSAVSFFVGGNRQLNLRTGRNEDNLRLARTIFQYVTTAGDIRQLLFSTFLLRQF